jgi:hypothetical protein
MKTTEPQVFIIESLRFSDEAEDSFEGRRISDMLALSGKNCKYFYVRTKVEFAAVLEKFWDSKYRYLHLSCHANGLGMETTLDEIPFQELADMLEPYLEGRRLFLSACEMSCSKLAKLLIPKSGCYSILGPSEKIDFADVAIFWASFYHKVFRLNSESINQRRLLATATVLSAIYSLPLNCFWMREDRFTKHFIKPHPKLGEDVILKWAIENLFAKRPTPVPD